MAKSADMPGEKMQLSNDDYMRVLNTPRIILEAGGAAKEQIQINTGMLALNSTFFATLLSKPGFQERSQGKIEISHDVAVVQIFTRWCYNGKLRSPTKDHRALQERKAMLIELWFFCETYGIPKLQNEIIDQLAAVLGASPLLLKQCDIHRIFSDTLAQGSQSLSELAATVLVVQLECADAKQTIHDYASFAKNFLSFMPLVYTTQRAWLYFSEKPKQPMTRIQLFLLREKDRFKEDEVLPEPWVLELCGITPKAPITPGEVVEIDDD